MSKTVAFPFELPTIEEIFFIAVNPKIAAIMHSGNGDEKAAIALIAPLLKKEDSAYGFDLPHKYGLNMSERTKLQAAMEADRASISKGMKLFKRISDETGMSYTEAQSMASQGVDGIEAFEPYIEELMEIEEEMRQVPLNIAEASIFMQRAIPKWQTKHTLALHPKILEQVMEFRRLEAEPITDETEEALEGEA